MQLRSITNAGPLTGTYVIIRSSFNIPLENGKPRNLFRLLRALPTLTYLREAGARTIIISHIGRKEDETLRPIYDVLREHVPVTWGGSITAPAFAALRDGMQDGDIVLCENLRQDPREEANDEALASLIAGYGDMYVNDAFAEAHRAHASTAGVAKLLPAYAGVSLQEEVTELTKALVPTHPSLFLLGGAKFETKIPLVEKFVDSYDRVFVGGALLHDIMKAKGYEIGASLVSDVSIVGVPFLESEKLLLPIDVVVVVEGGERATRRLQEVLPTDRIMDAGPETVAMLGQEIAAATTVLWNGPFGNYEAGYVEATEAVARLLANSDAFSIVGGGDTVAAIEKLGLNEQFGFVSIGGGAMLSLLEHGTTEALELVREVV